MVRRVWWSNSHHVDKKQREPLQERARTRYSHQVTYFLQPVPPSSVPPPPNTLFKFQIHQGLSHLLGQSLHAVIVSGNNLKDTPRVVLY
jgi:hypothetical protein